MSRVFRISVLLLSLALVSCSPGIGVSSGGQSDLKEASGEAWFRYELVSSTNHFRLELHAQANSGTIRWEVYNPDREVVWEGQIEPGEEFSEVHELPMKVGVWELDVYLDNTTGSYSYEWQPE